MVEKTATLKLNFEESGVLCHVLLKAMMDANEIPPKSLLGGRIANLYKRLADLNDCLKEMSHE